MKKHLGFALNIIALGLFVPGIYFPVFKLDMNMMADLGNSALQAGLINKELSILGTVEELWLDERHLVAFLILLFSVVIPVCKTLLVSIAYFTKNMLKQHKILNFVTHIGKWSMADVFVVAIFLAILSTDHTGTRSTQEVSLGLFKISFELSSETLSSAGQGFWFFTAYCLISLAGTQLFLNAANEKPVSPEMSSD